MQELTRALRLVIPDGSMMKVVVEWLAKAGISIILANSRIKTGPTNVPFVSSITLMRPQQIPIFLDMGHFDLAMGGGDWFANCCSGAVKLYEIPVGRATNQAVKIVLAVRANSGYKSIKDLPQNATIATEYVELVERYLIEKGRADIKVVRSYGGTEQLVNYGMDAIVDVTETGSSIRANGLEIIETILVSNTVIATSQEAYNDPELRPLIDWFVAVIKGVVEGEKYILLQANVPQDALAQAIETIGGMKGPTVSPLATPGWLELSSYIEKSRQHEIIFDLLQLGVEDICVLDCVSMAMGA